MVLCRVVRDSAQTRYKITPDIGNAISYIMDNLSEELSLEKTASHVLLSVSRFKQKFKDQLGTSPRNYINYQKIELAKNLLCETQNVTQTAMALGFSSSTYFSVVFRRFTSMSPTEYLRRAAKQK